MSVRTLISLLFGVVFATLDIAAVAFALTGYGELASPTSAAGGVEVSGPCGYSDQSSRTFPDNTPTTPSPMRPPAASAMRTAFPSDSTSPTAWIVRTQ